MQLLDLKEAAAMLRIKPRSLSDARYRARIGLPVVRIGKRIMFDLGDLEKLVAKSRERLPTQSG